MNIKLTLTSLFILILAVVLFLGIGFAPEVERDSEETSVNVQPSISYLDILNNPEFVEGMLSAVQTDDQAKMATLQSKAVEIGRVAGLERAQMDLLEGEKGLRFMRFRAARELFVNEFSSYFNQLKSIEELKSTYPEAADLFEKADILIQNRDKAIIKIAKEMANGDDYQVFLQQARSQWLEKAKQHPASL